MKVIAWVGINMPVAAHVEGTLGNLKVGGAQSVQLQSLGILRSKSDVGLKCTAIPVARATNAMANIVFLIINRSRFAIGERQFH